MATYSPDIQGPQHGKMSLAIEDMFLPIEDSDTSNPYYGVKLLGVDLVESTQDFSYFDAADGTHQTTVQHSPNWDLGPIRLLIDGPDLHKKIRDLQGNHKTFMVQTQGAAFEYSVDNPLAAGYVSVKPWNGDGGISGDIFQVEATHPVSGNVEGLTAEPTPVADLASPAQTAATIDLTWSAHADFLACFPKTRMVKGYNVYYKVTGSNDDYTRANGATLIANPLIATNDGTVTYQIAGLSASTSYDIATRAVYNFGLEFSDSNVLVQSTTA